MLLELKGDLSKFKVMSYDTIGDGSCFFHAIANAFYLGYRESTVDGEYISQSDIVKYLRQELAESLDKVDSNTGMTYYEQLANGNAADLGKTVEQYSLEGLKRHLDSNEPVGDVVITYVSYMLNKDIYILEASTCDVYNMPDIPEGKNTSVVVLHNCGHYEMIGVLDGDQWTTHFDSDHSFILAIRERMQNLKS